MEKKIREIFREVFKNINKHKINYVINTALLQLFISVFGIALLSNIFKFILFVTNSTNISYTDITSIVTNPLGILGIIVYFMCFALIIFFEFSVLTLMVYGYYNDTHFSIKTIIKIVFKKAKKQITKQLPLFLLYIVSIIPLANLGFSSALTQDLYIPKFITGEITKTNFGLIMYAIVLLVCFYINLRLLFTLPLSVINNNTLWQNMKLSWRLTKTDKVKVFFTVTLFELLFSAISLVLIILFVIAMMIINPNGDNLIIVTIFYSIINLIIFFFAVLSKIVIMAIIVYILIYYDVVDLDLKNHIADKKMAMKWKVALTSVLLLLGFVYNIAVIYTSEENKNIYTIAHRGYVDKGVENSIEALVAAAEENVDYVEMDILLTKDNRFIVMHDYNLKRLAKLDKNVADMTYDELVGLPIYQNEFESKIPSFEEYVAKAKELNVKLLVELKPHGKEPENYPQLFIDKMRELKIDKEYKTMSLNLKLMEKINELAPEIDTGYVIPFQFGNFGNNNIDFFVIEDFSYSDTLALQAEAQKKELFVWTINEEEQITNYLQKDIAGIISDKPNDINRIRKDLEENQSYMDRLFRLITAK